MAQIKLKRKTGTPNLGTDKLIEGEIGIIGSYLAYGPNSGGTVSVDIKVVASVNQDNSFIEQNTFKMVLDNDFQILNSSSTMSSYAKQDGFLYSTATDTQLLNATDRILVTRSYVDARAQGLNIKTNVAYATTTAITLSGNQTVDGFTTTDGDRVLVKNQASASANGIYVANSTTTWSRATDLDASDEVSGAYTFVKYGTANEDSSWTVTGWSSGSTIGVSNMNWTQFSAAGNFVADEVSLTKVANIFSIKPIATQTILGNSDIVSATPSAVSMATLKTMLGLGDAAYKGIVDSNSASAISTSSTAVPTERDIYYGLPYINNSHSYSSSTYIYAPTSGGTSGYVLQAAGATSTPAWSNALSIASLTTSGAITATGALSGANVTVGTGTTQWTINGTGTNMTFTGVGAGAITLLNSTVAATIAFTSDLHTRSHTMTSTSDHTAGNWKIFYSNTSGQVMELALGTTAYYLASGGTQAAPTWTALPSTYTPSAHAITSHTATAWRMFYSNATTTAVQGLAMGTDGQYLKAAGASATPAWTSFANLTAGTGLSMDSGSTYSPATARTISITSITSGSTIVGTLKYNGTTLLTGAFYGGTTSPSSTTARLNYDGWFYATQFEGIVDGGIWV